MDDKSLTPPTNINGLDMLREQKALERKQTKKPELPTTRTSRDMKAAIKKKALQYGAK